MNTHIVKPVRFGDQIEVEISSLAFGGDAVGRYQEFAVFVPGGLPGERVLVKITQVKDHYATGEILSVLRHSNDRVAPVCPVFEECGGCQWQHLSYPKQLLTKRQFVVDAFQRIGRLPNVTVQPCLPSPNPYAYRNKAMPVLSIRDGHFVSGIYEPRSHHLIPYQTCPIQDDEINRLIQNVLKKIDRSGLTPYQEKKHDGFLRHLAVRRGVKTGETLLAIVTRSETPEGLQSKPNLLPEGLEEILPRLARELMEENPGLVGVLQNINPSRTNIVFGSTTRVLAGRDHYFEILDGLKLKVSLNSFLQVNTLQADILHSLVREALGEPVHKKKWGTVLDLYSGIGTLSMAVSDRADYVVGVEEIGPAVEDARVNAESNQKGNIDFLEGDVSRILLGLKDKGLSQVDAVILDPPRKGVLPEVLSRVMSFHPERIIYVSCDPSTLARDLALLVKQGYAVEWAQPLDMFPQTYHVETVVRLTRETPLPPEILSQAGAELEPFRLSKQASPSSLNITAGLEALKENAGAAKRALGGLGTALLQLFSSVFSSFGEGIGNAGRFFTEGLRNSGLALGGFFRESGRKFLSLVSTLARGLAFSGGKGFRFLAGSLLGGWQGLKNLGLKLSSVFDRPEKNKNGSAPAEKTELPSEAPFPDLEHYSAALEAREIREEIQESVEISAPAWHRLPETAPAQEQTVSAPLPRKAVPSFPWSQKKFRWALGSILLLSGGFIAKATLVDSRQSAVMVPAVSQMIPDIIAVMPKRNFQRYEMVPFEVRINREDLAHLSKMGAMVEVFRGGQPVPMADGRTRLRLKRDNAGGKFVANWPIPYNPSPGTYVAQVVVSGPQWTSPKVFESAFTVSPLRSKGLYPGYAALTMEGGKQLVAGAVPALDGSGRMSAANAIEWAKFMGANLYCYLMGQTSIWDGFDPKAFPFNRGDIQTGRRYAKLAHDGGMKFAAYLTTFKVVGDGWEKAPYDFSLGYESGTDEVVKTRFISLDDAKRHQDIVDFLKEMEKEPLVDVVGLDYVRTGFAGYEMVDEFVKDLNVPGPANFWSLSKEERVHWLARTVELKTSHEVVTLFEWWRAHKVALVLKKVLEEAKMTKPVFTFTLGWQMGHQHGQDPAMFMDAGVDYSHIMLYEGDRSTLDSMKKQWPEYLARANGMYAMGEMVDFNWVQRSVDPPGPEELYNRQVETFQNWFPANSSVGMFWHDLYRIVYGIRGPYSTMEWAIAGGKAFSTLQKAQGLAPLEVTVRVPKKIPAGVRVPMSVEILNRSTENLKGVVLHQLDTTQSHYSDLATVGPFDLPAGNMMRVKSLYVNIPREDRPERGNQYMTAVMVEKPGSAMRAFDFIYVKKLVPGEPVERLEASSAQDGSNKESASPSASLSKEDS